MLPSLLYADARPKNPAPAGNREELESDLGLGLAVRAMAGEEPAIREAARAILFESAPIGVGDIIFRQKIIADALNNRELFFELYNDVAADLKAYEDARQRSHPGYARVTPVTVKLRNNADMLAILLSLADKIRRLLERLLERTDPGGVSEGARRFARAFCAFYSADFIPAARREAENLGRISEGSNLALGVKIGCGMKGTAYTIRSVNQPSFIGRALKRRKNTIPLDTFSMQLKALELRDVSAARLLSVASAVVTQTADDLKALYFELSFYAGCVNLHGALTGAGVRVCYPVPRAGEPDVLRFNGLSDISLALGRGEPPVANSADLDGMRLTIVTGANQGGKSTFLRSVGCAQLMAQCGMFAAAERFEFCMRPRVFTHFCRPEDMAMDSGKLDEELARLDHMTDGLRPGALLLMNESFSSTAEREGAALAREVIGAYCDAGVKVVYVTHLYEYARSAGLKARPDVLLLRAERLGDGSRTYAIKPGVSLPTSYGMDLFSELFGTIGGQPISE